MAPRELYSLRLRDSSEQTEGAEKSIEFVVQCLKCFIWCSGSDGGDDERNERYLENLILDGEFRREWIQMAHEVVSKMNRKKMVLYFDSKKTKNLFYGWVLRIYDTIGFVKNLLSFSTLSSTDLRAFMLNELR